MEGFPEAALLAHCRRHGNSSAGKSIATGCATCCQKKQDVSEFRSWRLFGKWSRESDQHVR